MTSAPPARAGRFRPDIEGLRAVAVLMVLAYHAGLPGTGGGFAGVDVFFVISGFLITGLLVEEVERTGRVALGRFYARRARRLLPAAVLVLLASALLTWWLVPQLRWREIGGDLVAAALYLLNWRLADRSVDYLAEDSAPSPVQHYWSLAVEEQFYIVWPLLLLAGAWLVGRRRALGTGRKGHPPHVGHRPTLFWMLLALVVPSFLWSLHQSAESPQSAFFVTPTRLWELGLGGLVAVCAPVLALLPQLARWVLGWSGLGAVVASTFALDGGLPWPGYAALLPTLGTAAVVVAGLAPQRGGPDALLATRPLQTLGGLSYSLYLWHWPPLVAAAAVLGDLEPWQGVLIVLASAVPAWLGNRYVENPIRYAPRLAVPRRALAMGVATALVGVTAGLGLVRGFDAAVRTPLAGQQGAAVLGDGEAATATTSAPPPDEAATTSAPPPDDAATTSAPPPDDGATEQQLAASRFTTIATPDVDRLDLTPDPDAITPDPLVATSDLPQVYADDCDGSRHDQVVRCDYGDPDGDVVVALVGDSKIAQWADALDRIGRERGWQVRTYYWSACAWVDVAVPDGSSEPDEDCLQWGREMSERLTGAEQPDVVLVSSVKSRAFAGEGGGLSRASLVEGYVDTWSRMGELGVPVVALADTTQPGMNVPECVVEHRDDPAACAFERNAGSGTPALAGAVERVPTATMVDMNDWVCPVAQCPPVIGDVMVWRQGSHITNTYAVSLARPLEQRLVAALGVLGVEA